MQKFKIVKPEDALDIVQEAIAASIAEDRTITIEVSISAWDEFEGAAMAESDDYAHHGCEIDAWGDDEDGAHWRIESVEVAE